MSVFTVRILRLIALKLFLMVSFSTLAADPVTLDASVQDVGKMEGIQEKWSTRVLELANSIDGFFGNERIEEDAQQTRIKLRLDLNKEESSSLDTRLRLSARLSLPRLENKWAVIINGDDGDEDDSELEENQDRSLALRFDAKNSLNRNLAFDIGLKRPDSSYELFGRVRYRKTDPLGRWIRRFDNRLFLYSSFGLEYDGVLEFDRVLPPSLLFRSKTRLRWWENDKKCNGGFCPEQHFILYQRMKSPAHALSYEVGSFFESKPTDGSSDYLSVAQLKVRYRHKTPWDWAFIEFRPSVSFSRIDDYGPSWGALIRLEAIFGYKPQYDSLQFGPERDIQPTTPNM